MWYDTSCTYEYRQPDWRNSEPDKPLSQILISALVILLFVVVMGDWSFIAGSFERRQAQIAVWNSPEGQKLRGEIFQMRADLIQKAQDKKLTIEEAAKAQNRFEEICIKIGEDWTDHTTLACRLSRKVFVDSWQPEPWRTSVFKKMCAEEDQFRRQQANSIFTTEFITMQSELNEASGKTITSQDFKRFGLWLLKWYFLFTLPALIIAFINMKYVGKKVMEEILFQPREILLACCFGPIGMFAISDVAGEIKRYNRLRRQFMADKEWGYRLSQAEENALWLQVMEPMLKFEQAIELVKDPSNVVRKPALVCSIIWIISLFSGSLGKVLEPAYNAVVSIQTALVETETEENNNGEGGSGNDQFDNGFELALLPVRTTQTVLTTVEMKMVDTWQYPVSSRAPPGKPRGPPAVVRRTKLAMMPNWFSPDCETQRGEGS